MERLRRTRSIRIAVDDNWMVAAVHRKCEHPINFAFVLQGTDPVPVHSVGEGHFLGAAYISVYVSFGRPSC